MVVLQLRQSGGEAGAEEVHSRRQTGVLIGVVVAVVVVAAAAAVAVVLPSSEGELDLVPAAVPLMAKVCSILLQLHAFLRLYGALLTRQMNEKTLAGICSPQRNFLRRNVAPETVISPIFSTSRKNAK